MNHSFTTDINIAASLHLLASIPNAIFLEFCVEDSPLRMELARTAATAGGRDAMPGRGWSERHIRPGGQQAVAG